MRVRATVCMGVVGAILLLPQCFVVFLGRLKTSTKSTINYYLIHTNYHYYDDVPEGVPRLNKRPATVRLLEGLKNALQDTPQPTPKLVLFWTTWFGRAWWVRMGGRVNLEASGCPEVRCVFTHDRSKWKEAAAILFQVSTLNILSSSADYK